MKKLIISSFLGVLLVCTNAPAQEQKFKEKIEKEFAVSASNTVAIHNMAGFVKVEGYSGSKVLFEINKTISAKDKTELEKGKEEFKLMFEQKNDNLLVYIKEPWDSRPNRNSHDNWDEKKDIKYHYQLDFTVKVPMNCNLMVSTVNNGMIEIENITGDIKANNVNGAIALKNIKGKTSVRTVNGNVDVHYSQAPTGDSDYYTLNGDLTVFYPANLSADCEYKSFNGDLFTDFPEVKMLPPKVVKNAKTTEGTTKYRLKSNTFFRIGKGGQNLHFETFNGNIYIKKHS